MNYKCPTEGFVKFTFALAVKIWGYFYKGKVLQLYICAGWSVVNLI